MQQTQTYKLNKPNADDPMAIAPLNENADKLEGALVDLVANHAALDTRVTVLEAKKFVFGSYSGSSEAQTIELGFTPKFVIIQALSYSLSPRLSFRSDFMPNQGSPHFRIIEGGFAVSSGNHPYVNSQSTTYIYLAFV